MNELLELNSENLKKGYFWCAGLLSFIFILTLVLDDSEIPLKWIIIIFSGTLIFAPLFILSVWSWDWYRNRRNYNRIYCKNPYRNLKQIGFYNRVKSVIHPNGMIDYIYFSKINKWEIYFEVSLLKPKVVTFSIRGNIPEFKKAKSEIKKISPEKFEIDRYGIFWKINTKKENIATTNTIEKEIQIMIKIAEKLNCEKTITVEYEKVLNTTKNCG
jgi:hypothetical protein